jgi:hypothetical protein
MHRAVTAIDSDGTVYVGVRSEQFQGGPLYALSGGSALGTKRPWPGYYNDAVHSGRK